jgi:hypothetical protein
LLQITLGVHSERGQGLRLLNARRAGNVFRDHTRDTFKVGNFH